MWPVGQLASWQDNQGFQFDRLPVSNVASLLGDKLAIWLFIEIPRVQDGQFSQVPSFSSLPVDMMSVCQRVIFRWPVYKIASWPGCQQVSQQICIITSWPVNHFAKWRFSKVASNTCGVFKMWPVCTVVSWRGLQLAIWTFYQVIS